MSTSSSNLIRLSQPIPLTPIPFEGPLSQEDDFPVELTIGGNGLKISGSYVGYLSC